LQLGQRAVIHLGQPVELCFEVGLIVLKRVYDPLLVLDIGAGRFEFPARLAEFFESFVDGGSVAGCVDAVVAGGVVALCVAVAGVAGGIPAPPLESSDPVSVPSSPGGGVSMTAAVPNPTSDTNTSTTRARTRTSTYDPAKAAALLRPCYRR